MWKLLKATVLSFIEDEALSRGAAIAFYTVTSLAPILLIVVAIAGLAFGREAAQHAITAQLTGLMGTQTADVLQSALAGASSKSSGILATIIGVVTLLVTASGVFGEMQTALNKIWDAEPRTSTVSRLIWARAVSLGLGGRSGVSAAGFARGECGAYRFRDLSELSAPLRKPDPLRCELRRVARADLGAVCGDL